MNQQTAKIIYWSLAPVSRWAEFNQDDETYSDIKKARTFITEKYRDLKKSGRTSDLDEVAKIEWLKTLKDL